MERYSEDAYLMISGIQHMAFCERQWALIHLEQVWSENALTIEGQYLHERTDDPYADESRKQVRIVRSMPLVSHQLGLRGIADVVEFYASGKFIDGETCQLSGRAGWWRPVPVEYKKGRPKIDDRDAVQLCAQGICLEEMLKVSVPVGYIYYGEIKRREKIELDERLREYTFALAQRMHELAREGRTPKAPKGRRCSLCSLVENCQPRWMLRHRSVANYLAKMCQMEDRP